MTEPTCSTCGLPGTDALPLREWFGGTWNHGDFCTCRVVGVAAGMRLQICHVPGESMVDIRGVADEQKQGRG
jgi:hypothetical protein